MTSEFMLAPGEQFIQCPYNTAHLITNARFLTHLDKCRKAYIKGLTLEGRQKHIKICRHNASHHIPSPELRFHEQTCTDAFSVVRHMAYHNSEEGNKQYEERRKKDSDDWQQVKRGKQPGSSSTSGSSKIATSTWNHIQEEDWDAECTGNAPGYDPEVKLKSEVIMYNPSGLTKSERKKFRNEVRQRAAEVGLKGEPVAFPTASDFDSMPEITDLKISEESGRYSTLVQVREEDDDGEEDEERHGGGPSIASSRQKFGSSSAAASGSSYQRSTGAGAPRVEMTVDDYYHDSDDFEGNDPYV